MRQLLLFKQKYFCQSCERFDAPVLVGVKRFRVCSQCHERYVPSFEIARNDSEREQISNYHQWISTLDKKYPRKCLLYRQKAEFISEGRLNYNPICRCGNLVDPLKTFDRYRCGLWGGPFHWRCEKCRLEEQIKYMAGSSLLHITIHPDWDDEDWLDYLYRDMPRAFELKILPDMWFELRQVVA